MNVFMKTVTAVALVILAMAVVASLSGCGSDENRGGDIELFIEETAGLCQGSDFIEFKADGDGLKATYRCWGTLGSNIPPISAASPAQTRLLLPPAASPVINLHYPMGSGLPVPQLPQSDEMSASWVRKGD